MDDDRNIDHAVTGDLHDKRLKRIARMLHRAEHPTGSDDKEAEHSREMALNLMVQYCIEEASVRAAMGEAEAPDDPFEKFEMIIKAPNSWPQSNFYACIADHLGCKAVRSRIYERDRRNRLKSTGDVRMYLIGRRSTAQNVMMLIRSLNTQCLIGLNRRYTALGTRDRTFAHSYCTNFAETCYQRVRDAFKQEQSGPSSAGTLVVQSDAEKSAAAMNMLFPDLKKASPIQTSNRAGAQMGRTDGEMADLGQTRLRVSRTAIGS